MVISTPVTSRARKDNTVSQCVTRTRKECRGRIVSVIRGSVPMAHALCTEYPSNSRRNVPQFLTSRAGSEGRRNTCAQFTRGSLEPQSFSRALIETQRDLVQLGLRVAGKVGSLRQILPQQAVGVFVGSSLPGAVRITEVNFHIRGYREGFVFSHLQPAIPGQQAPQRCGKPANLPTQGGDDRSRVFAAHLDQGCKTRMPLHQRRDVTVFCATNEIAFPMTGDGAILDLCRSFPDGDGIDDLTARVFKDTRMLRTANAALGAQVPQQLFLQHSAGLDE